MKPNSDNRGEKFVAGDMEKLVAYVVLSVSAYFVFRYGYVAMRTGSWLSYIVFAVLLGVAGRIAYRPLQVRINSALAPKDKNLEWDREVSSKFIAGAGVAVLGLMVVLLCIDLVVHKNANAADGGSFLGTFGDFFGGVINPFLSFITLIALAFTFGMQRLQLIDARNQADENKESADKAAELARLQAFETTFFHMLTLHHSTVEQLGFDSKSVLPEILCPNETPHANLLGKSSGRNVFAGVLATMDLGLYSQSNGDLSPVAIYEIIQKKHNYVLGHYFRHMYQILALIERAFPGPVVDRKTWRESAPKKYSNVLRAQLSANELILLYFNCSGTLVDKGEFRALVKKYELLEHLPLEYDREANQLSFHDYCFKVDVTEYLEENNGAWKASAFGENPSLLEALPRFPRPGINGDANCTVATMSC